MDRSRLGKKAGDGRRGRKGQGNMLYAISGGRELAKLRWLRYGACHKYTMRDGTCVCAYVQVVRIHDCGFVVAALLIIDVGCEPNWKTVVVY